MRGPVLRRGAPCLLLVLVTACGGGRAEDPGPRADACSLISRSTAAEVLGSRVERTEDDSKDLGGVGSNILECRWVGTSATLVLGAYARRGDGAGRPRLLGIPGVRGDLAFDDPPYAADLSASWDDSFRVRIGLVRGGRSLLGPAERAAVRPPLRAALTEVKASLSEKDFGFHAKGS